MYARTQSASSLAPQTGASTTSTAGHSGIASKAAAVLSFAYCVVGTMGVLTPELMAQRDATSNWGLQYRNSVQATTGALEATAIALEPTPADDLARIRDVLKPTVLELATLFGVSRQAVYDWQSGAQPNEQTTKRLAELASAANIFAQAGVAVSTQTLRRKVSGGVTVLDAVLSGANAVQLARSLVKTLERESSQRERMAQQLSGRVREPVDSSHYGAPNLAEDA